MIQRSNLRPPPVPGQGGRRVRLSLGGVAGYVFFVLLAAVPIVFWFGCRIEPRDEKFAVLVRKTGQDLPTGRILAVNEGEKGVQLEVKPEGRYFRNPYVWDWEIHPMTDIPPGRLGVMTRLFGEELSHGKIIATESSKGILPEVLRPGKYRLNPYAYHVEQFDAISIRPGHVGVVTRLIGKDVLSNPSDAELKNDFLVDGDMDSLGKAKGVIADVLDPGTYYLHPYIYSVVEVNLQGQRFEMSGDDVISFLTMDGFTVTVEGTIEFALTREYAALLTHRVGDMDDIVKKVILPRARGFSRIEGSKHPAINFIVGETRQKFQSDLDAHLKERCENWGVDIRSVLVRKIQPPDEIASINREREVAVQDANKYTQQILQAKSRAELVKQEMLAIQNKEKVEADTKRIRAVINAEQGQAVVVIDAERELEVAKVNLAAATFQAEAIMLKAEGQRDAIHVQNVAEAEVLAEQAKAFGSGMELARYLLYQKLGPRIKRILSNDGPEGLGDLFRPFMPTGKEVAP